MFDVMWDLTGLKFREFSNSCRCFVINIKFTRRLYLYSLMITLENFRFEFHKKAIQNMQI